jgi:hypothetical protein
MDAAALGSLLHEDDCCQSCNAQAAALLVLGGRVYCQPCAEWLGLVPIFGVRSGNPWARAQGLREAA